MTDQQPLILSAPTEESNSSTSPESQEPNEPNNVALPATNTSQSETATNNDSKTNTNSQTNPTEWSCRQCTLTNPLNRYTCSVCDAVRYDYNGIYEHSWNIVLSFNDNNLTQVPQWIHCSKCKQWRTALVPIALIKTWTAPNDYICPNQGCGTPSPNVSESSKFEIFALTVQRCLKIIQSAGIDHENQKECITQIQSYSLQCQQIRDQKMRLNRNDTIVIDEDSDNNEIAMNDPKPLKSPSPWVCNICTFENKHLGNLCAMCDTAKAGSTVTKMSDEMYARELQKSFNEPSQSHTPNAPMLESSPDLGTQSHKREMSLDSTDTSLFSTLPPNAQIGPFGVITRLDQANQRMYYMPDTHNRNVLKWGYRPPTTAQTWVRERFGDLIDTLPRMNKAQRKQMEQMNGNGHYYGHEKYTFNDSNDTIDLSNDNIMNDLWQSENKPITNVSHNTPVIKHGKIDWSVFHKKPTNNAYKNPKEQQDMGTDAPISYPGMHAAEEVVDISVDGHGIVPNRDKNEQSVAKMLNLGLRQGNVVPLDHVRGMSVELFPHQKKGVAWMLQMEKDRLCKGGFLCDQMGVGKTIQIIALMLQSRKDARDEAKEKYKSEGYVSESDYCDSVDSNDDTCGGFVVRDDEIDFRSDKGESEESDTDWLPDMDSNRNRNKKSKKKIKRGKKRKYSDLDSDSEKTVSECDETMEIGCVSDLGNKNENKENINRNGSVGLEEIEESSPDLVTGLLARMKKKNSKKESKASEPNRKRRKLNNGKTKKTKKKKKKRKQSNSVYDQWLSEHNLKKHKMVRQSAKPWLNVKQRTLIIGPLAIIDQWAEEIESKAPKQFKICVYHGSGRKKKYNKHTLKKYDCVITTFGHVSSEYHKGNEEEQDGLFKFPNGFFHRVVLDEAHTIKNPSSIQSKACACIGNKGVKVRWCLTGTPIQNKLLDLFPMARFLQIRQCGTAKDFKKFLRLDSSKNVHLRGRSKQLVTSFLAGHMLRRLKSEVVDNLVSKTEEVMELEFDEAEDSVYKAFQNHARSRFNKFVQQGTAKKNYAHILVLLLRLRQICDHPFLAMKVEDGSSEGLGEADSDGGGGMEEEKGDPLQKIDAQIIKRLNEREDGILDSECPICLDVFDEGVMFRECGHLVCKQHLYDLNDQCPECRGRFSVNGVIAFSVIIKSELIDEKHKKSLLADGGANGLIMDGNVVAEQMGNVSLIKAMKRRIVWRKVSKAKGKFRSAEQIQEENEQKNEMSQEIEVEDKLKKMQKKFDWNEYIIDEEFEAQFDDDNEDGYTSEDKYPNQEFGWQFIPSSKTKMMMQKIQCIRKNKPNDKVIVFSQFTTMLRVLQRVLNKHRINYLVYDGSKTRKQRKEILNDFKNDPYNDMPVILMSLKCAALGLNLTCANHVIFCDLWWNPAIEAQAIDRVHRIGQKKRVYVTRMIIKTSVEERILALQRDKQMIADSTLDGANFAKKHGLSVADLARLFGSDEHIMNMAERQSGNTGFTRDSLMNQRRRPAFPNNNSHNRNHNSNSNSYNGYNNNNANVNNNVLDLTGVDEATANLIRQMRSGHV